VTARHALVTPGPSESAGSLSIWDLLVSDGPFAETKEQIAGFCVLKCTDLDEAIEVASRHPTALVGTFELRSYVE
jgi:hypothetical protein